MRRNCFPQVGNIDKRHVIHVSCVLGVGGARLSLGFERAHVLRLKSTSKHESVRLGVNLWRSVGHTVSQGLVLASSIEYMHKGGWKCKMSLLSGPPHHET